MLIETAANIAIIAASSELLDAEERSADALAARLGVMPPAEWPPEFNGPKTRAWIREMLAAHPDEPGYASWYIIGDGQLAGICGFKGPPNQAGEVEIGYSVVPSAQQRGYASGAVGLLVTRGFRDPRVTAVLAETLPALIPSRKVLERCGFTLASGRVDEQLGEILRYEARKPASVEGITLPR